MPVPRNLARLFVVLFTLSAVVARAADAPARTDQQPATGSPDAGTGTSAQPAEKSAASTGVGTTSIGKATLPTISAAEREQLKQQIMEEVRKELDQELKKTREQIQEEVNYTEQEKDARNYDASTLKDLQQSVNMLQIHGYYRVRGDLFDNANLGRGTDAAGNYLFPYGNAGACANAAVSTANPSACAPAQNQTWLGAGDMRLRLEPTLRVSDYLTIHAQIDVLDNVVFGGNPAVEPFFPPPSGVSAGTPTASVLANQIAAQAVNVKRVWAEVRLPFGELDFGRMGYHWGEGMMYNDGNCLDCDFGNTFDRLMLKSNQLAGHVFAFSWDLLGVGPTAPTTLVAPTAQSIPLYQLATSYRFGLQVQRILSDAERKRRLDNNEWALQYGLMGAYRMQGYQYIAQASSNVDPIQNIDARFGEADVYFRGEKQKFKLAAEGAFFGGQEGNRLFTDALGDTTAVINQPLNFVEGAAFARARYFFLKQDMLMIGLDAGWASGGKQAGMGVRTYETGSGPNGSTVRGDIDGPKYNCSATSCTNNQITNFVMNPDFRVDDLMWRYIFTQVSGAYIGRALVGFKPGGRASGGADDYGLDLNLNFIYSQAVYASETPSGYYVPLAFEIDANAAYTTKEGLYVGMGAAFLIPLAGLNNTLSGTDASVGYLYHGFLGVRF